MMVTMTLNGARVRVDADEAAPLLWALRDALGLTWTKFGCSVGACGACTVHLDGEAVLACATPLGDAAGRSVTTIEGLSPTGDHPVQRAWLAEQAPQCSYCQSGTIMRVAALLAVNANPTRDQIVEQMSASICRCATCKTTLGAGIAEVSRDAKGIRVRRFCAAVDPGMAIHPGNLRAQVEGGIIFGLSGLMRERITISAGEVGQSNFHDYDVMQMRDAPEIAVTIVESGAAASGVPEIGEPMTGAAVANAVFALTGERQRRTPFDA